MCGWLRIGLCGGMLAALSAGCRTETAETAKTPEYTGIASMPEAEAVAIGRRCGENLLEAVRTRDYERACADLAPELTAKVSEQVFSDFCRMLVGSGELTGYEYLTMLEQPPMRLFLWKLTLQGQPEDGAGPAEVVTVNTLFRVLVGKLDDKYVILFFGVN